MTRVVVLDYGSGNLRSAVRSLERTGAEVILTDDVGLAAEAPGLVVPGVGAFAACMAGLRGVGGVELIEKRLADDRPTLGICVGHQVLFDRGVEHGVQTPGVGVLPGTIERLAARRLPHMGWNTVTAPQDSALFAGVTDERFYFVHSYAARALDRPALPDAMNTWAEHEGDRFVAAVEWRTLSSTQFHPEKSGDAGARLLTNWVATL